MKALIAIALLQCLASAPAHASAVRSVSFSFPDSTHETVTIDSRFGLIVLNVSVSGTTWTISGTKDGSSIGTVTRTNPSIATLEADGATTIAGVTKDGTVAAMQIAVHFFSTNPVNFTLLTADIGVTIPADWWD